MSNDNESNYKQIRSQRCLVCNKLGVDVAHVKTRGSGGSDHINNLMPLCREHHSLQHTLGILTFIRTFISVSSYLDMKGWTIENGKLINISESEFNVY